ncbi:zinc-binding dehydrogenase [Thalassobacillus sp. CUG 92003]|uniref:quinone oxidoreductase family protein n=1 Tax=Thalassobacillus sp. CUG 92003 TaxID=2736641 RepID=UPI0015E79585
MKAIIQHEYGEADVLSCTDQAKPDIGENEVLIKTAYTSVNYADIKKRNGNKASGSFPFTLGLDVAGTIEDVTYNGKFSVGDRVIAFPSGGSYAEYVKAHDQLVFKIPDELSLDVAATMPTVSILSYILLHEIAHVKTTDTIVIHSAAGGVGSMLVQLAHVHGVKHIIGTVGNMNKAAYVKNLGADAVYTYETFKDAVLNETQQAGADVIFDSVAGDVTRSSLDCLALYGTLVQFGNSSGKAGTFKTSDVHSSCRNVKGFSLGTTRQHDPSRLAPVAEKVLALFASEHVTLPIAQVFNLEEASQAHALIESRQYEGKVLLKV